MISHRTANEGDASDMSALILSFQAELLLDPMGHGAEEFLASVSAEAVRRYLTSSRYHFIVAHEAERLIGVVGMKNVSHLFYLFVDRAHQRRGLGRELWGIAKAKTRGIGYHGSFTVNASLNAVPAYAKLGFREVGPKIQMHGVAFVPMQSGDAHAA